MWPAPGFSLPLSGLDQAAPTFPSEVKDVTSEQPKSLIHPETKEDAWRVNVFRKY